MEVHPLADIFPMMSEDELADLAADIKANGLVHPIMLDAAGKLLVDGRNRLRACEIAGIEPEFDHLNGQDPAAFIVSANLARRNLTKGQQAMALAMIYPEPAKGGRGKKSEANTAAKRGGFSQDRLDAARAVLRNDHDLARSVLSGAQPLDGAHEIVRKRQQEASGVEAKAARLREVAPDLADLVAEERMTLAEATAAANQRAEDQRVAIEAARRAAENLISFCTNAVTIAGGYELGERGLLDQEKLARLDDAMALLHRLHMENDQ